ncbi:hypothetical protein [Oceanobacillus damuensis]|uniref:hypothetical protein n=1 Tax=Oceanobacillus damuensis TaxID=937928 RepID=UPI00082DC82A|nr:hypothetical protein [Oceanobacillus damuensis]
MELKENIYYVTPEGMAFDKETYDKSLLIVSDAWETIKESLTNALQAMKESFERIFERIEYLRQQEHETRHIRHTWNVPKNTCRDSQVMNKKPLVTHIRSNL